MEAPSLVVWRREGICALVPRASSAPRADVATAIGSVVHVPHRSQPYRPDIDGLRAISVLAVILFHAKVPGFRGGYVGVDVFFVISGYLITQVLMAPSELSVAGQLRNFYVRRCRRILPALIVMLLASTCIAYWLFLPGDLLHFGKLLSFTAAFIGNFAIWRDGGYFDLRTPFNPLLHLWSIGVEEQFYVFFPLIFLAGSRALKGDVRVLLAGAGLVSLALCVWASYHKPTANFFLVPTRAWELALGSLVALGVGRPLSAVRAGDALAGAALLAILGCVLWYDDGLRYPGLYALVPCLAAAILLATAGSSGSRVGRWMSAKPLVFTGLISYSLYLWHVPVLAFAGYYHIRPLGPWHIAALLPSIYLLSAASWRFVEEPVRGRVLLAADSRFLTAAGGMTLVIAVLGVITWRAEGLPGRLDPVYTRVISDPDSLRHDAMDCVRPLSAIAAGSLCSVGPRAGATADVVVWGDSHAIVLLPAYERIATARNVRLHAAVGTACRPLLDAASKNDKPLRRLSCSNFNRAAVSAIEAINPALVILNAYWTYPDLDFAATEGNDLPSESPPFQLAFERTLRAIGAGRRKVCVVGDVPTLEYAMPYAYVMARRRGIDPAFIAPRPSEVERQLGELNRQFADLKRRHTFTLVSLSEVLCSGPTCPLLDADGRSIYRDNNHLSVAGAYFVGSSLEACFDGLR
jgi:peptidoglycan/LPS O-acetylase OafA/YrhL